MKKLQFKIEQIALNPTLTDDAIKLLSDMGLGEWYQDQVQASGEVFGRPGANTANLSFNYQADANFTNDGPGRYVVNPEAAHKPLELEVLAYIDGPNWTDSFEQDRISHLGMHVTEEELAEWSEFFKSRGFRIAQEVYTSSHTNPHIKDSRRYHYVIFDTHETLGVDVKFIVRKILGAADV